MNKYALFLLFTSITYAAFAQNILVQPYLQDAEPTTIKIMWESNGGSSHKVDWGSSSANLNQTVAATSATSSGSNIIHTTMISGLTANTRYYYQVRTDGQSSAIFDFITPPLKSSNQSFNLVAISDMQKDGSNPNIFNQVVHDGIIDHLHDEHGNDLPTDLGLVLIPGDLVPNGNTYNQWKNDFFDPANPLFAHVPVYPVLGNHENNSPFYFQYFELPDNGSPGFEEHWWYKDYSNVRIIGLNSNSGYRIQAQLDWLETTLDAACADADIDFVFAQLHHPHLSELWTPGELDYTGDVIELMETFTTNCGKPSIHFFGHTHGYSRGQSRDHEHLWVNVATAGGAIDNWGEFPNADYAEFNTSIDEYGFVVVNVSAGASPEFTLRRISRGDQNITLDNVQQDAITLKKTDNPPATPLASSPSGIEVCPDNFTLTGSAFNDPGDFHQAAHWQVTATCGDFTNPVFESWKQHENWYNEVDTQAGDLLTDEEVASLAPNGSYCWRVRYRDDHLKWSNWSIAAPFTTGDSDFTTNLLVNGGGEDGVNNWTVVEGSIESLGPGECAGINPRTGNKYLAVGGLCAGNETAYSEVAQSIDISSEAAQTDAGNVSVRFGGYLSNFGGSDQPSLHLEYLDATNTLLATSPTLTTLNSSWTSLATTQAVPVNTRFVKVVLTGTRNVGTDNDSYFDDLFVTLDNSPGNNCSNEPLPVEFVAFVADCSGDLVRLSWEVTAEIAVQHYQVMRSADLQGWVTVGSVLAEAAYSSAQQHYSYTSRENLVGENVYYRLKVVDSDGSFHFSPIINTRCAQAPEVKISPNPVSAETVTISFEQPESSTVKIELVNLLGQLVFKQENSGKSGLNETVISLEGLAAGIYAVNIKTAFWQWSELLILK